MTSAASYLRLPSADPNAQRLADELRRFATNQGWNALAYYRDEDGTEAASELLAAMRSRRYDVVVVYRVEHLFRSLHAFCVTMNELDLEAVRLIAIADELDTAAPAPIARLAAAFAEVERRTHRESSLRGMARAQRQGARIGRPPARFSIAKAARMRGRGYSIETIATRLGVSPATVSRKLADLSKPLS